MKQPALIRLVFVLGLSLALSNNAHSQSATPPSDSVCVPKYQMDGIMADLNELDERRATADSAHRAVLTIKGQSMQLNVDNGQLRAQNSQLQTAVKQNRGQAFRETVNAVGTTFLKIGGVLLAVYTAVKLF